MGASESKPPSVSDADWTEHEERKLLAKSYYKKGQTAEDSRDYDNAYKWYCKAIEERMFCDAYYARHMGGGFTDEGHANFTKSVVLARDRVDEKRKGTTIWGPKR